jgi:hypothetical protein
MSKATTMIKIKKQAAAMITVSRMVLQQQQTFAPTGL